MKHYANRVFGTVLFSALMALAIPLRVHAQPGCSNATLNGSFGYTNTGTILAGPGAGPFGGVGRQTFDGKGNTEATATVSVNGNISHATIKGTYVMNANCTGSMTLLVTVGTETFTNHVNLVIVHGGGEFRAINADPGIVLTTFGSKQSRGD
jgi:hypothetical protein